MPTRKGRGRGLVLLVAVLTGLSGSALSHADVVLDGTMGGSGALAGPAFAIEASDGTTVGSNLFHSFGEFNLTSAQSATFNGPAVQKVIKTIGRSTAHDLRGKAVILTLFDTGVRAAELCGMREEDLDWRDRTIMVTGKAGKQRRVSVGHVAAQAIERYLRNRGAKSDWLWLSSGNKPLAINGLRMMLERRFQGAEVRFRGAHAFRRGFAMDYLAAGGQEGDLKELGGWGGYAMVSRYARANAGERAVAAHKKLSPGDRLNVR